MKAGDQTSARRAIQIYESLKQGYNLSHTQQMIHYAESEMTEEERTDGLLRTINEVGLICRKHLNDRVYQILIATLDCAREDIEKNDYWAAIGDISTVEVDFLQEHLPETPNSDMQTLAPVFLARKILRSFGGDAGCIKGGKKLHDLTEALR